MFNNDSNNIDLKTKESQCHLKSVCLWDSNDFLKLLKFQKNVFYKIFFFFFSKMHPFFYVYL